MNPILRTLEDWATHQDYFWFLALLAWCGVLGAEIRRRPGGWVAPESGWLVALAVSMAAGAVVQLVLLAQNIMVPYTRLDAAMGAAQACGASALAWAATAGLRHKIMARVLMLGALAALAVLRMPYPVAAGWALAVAQAALLLAILRSRAATLMPATAALFLALAPLIATHGPWAYAIRHGRRNVDWSYFSLFDASISALAGVVIAAVAWRRRFRQTVPEMLADGALRRDLRRAVVVLSVWLAGGMLLAIWYGRIARRAFEENFVARIETAVVGLDPRVLADALGPELRITSIVRLRYPSGAPVDVAIAPRTREPVYLALRAQLARIHERNPDLSYLHIHIPRQGQMLLFSSQPRRNDDIRHVIHHTVTPVDLERLASRRSFLSGPTRTTWGPQFSANVPLFHPDSQRLLGWLVGEVSSTRWAVTFTQARLQTMALVGAGVGLWTLAVAYRLRREARDASERKASAAAAADRMKSAFLAKVSHELRTPVQSVLGYGELLASKPLPEPQRAWLEALRSHGGVMLRLVNDLIDLGALQSGAFRLEPGPVEVAAVLEDCCAALRPAIQEKRLEFSTETAADAPRWIEADGVRLRQVLLNLLTNAVKFTPGGRVTLQVRRAPDAQIEFIVSDTGPGIPAPLRSRLFQPFARLDPAATGGSGLGLTLVHGLCAAMGGTVQLDETAADGARFIARLPLRGCEPPAPHIAAKAAPTQDFTGLRVLVAEDNTLVRELLAAFLRENGAEVTVATDGRSALTCTRDQSPDVLLLDIGLPEMDGIQVAEALRTNGPARLRIIGLSAHASRDDERRARTAGMDEYLAKPVSLRRLGEALVDPTQLPATRNAARVMALPEELRTRLAAQFTAETPHILDEMRASLARGDWEQLRARAHYLKNSADILGATQLQDACARLAAVAAPMDPATARMLVQQIEAAIPADTLLTPEHSGAVRA